jgi:hypothetical protein
MKTEQLIVQYLYSNKKVTLQDIGVFNIASDIHIPEDSNKDIVLPTDAIQFVYDPKAPVDDGLVAFIMESTRKIKPLAYSDLESFIILNKQFLNIGKELVFEGMGTLQKTQGGDYAFTQATTSHVTVEEMPKLITEKVKEKISFATPQKETNGTANKNIFWLLLGFVLVIGVSAVIYFYNKKTNDSGAVTAVENIVTDTLPTVKKDTILSQKKIVPPVNNAINDSNNFYVVIREYTDLQTAQKSLKKYVSFGNYIILTTKDSVHYKLRFPFVKPLSDTLRVKDSLSKFFQVKAYVELP